MADGDGVSRRRVLSGGMGAAALAAIGTQWSGKGEVRPPGSRPRPDLPEGTDTLPQIEHIVVLMMENHSYDNRLGMLHRPGADGFRLGPHHRPLASNPYPDGRIQHAFHMPTTCQLPAKPAQDWLDSHIQYHGGCNDGFVRSLSGPVAMGYWQREDQPFYHSLASVFPVADRYFAATLGQTFPNRRYLLAATSFGQVGHDLPTATKYPPNGTIYDRLDAHGISWKTYYDLASNPTTLLFPPLFFKNPTKHVSNTQFLTDAAAGTLPNTTTYRRRAPSRPTTSRRRYRRIRSSTASPGTASGCPAWSCRPGRAGTTSRTPSTTTPASSSWSRPSGTCPQ
jgi:phospholipase C